MHGEQEGRGVSSGARAGSFVRTVRGMVVLAPLDADRHPPTEPGHHPRRPERGQSSRCVTSEPVRAGKRGQRESATSSVQEWSRAEGGQAGTDAPSAPSSSEREQGRVQWTHHTVEK